MKYSFTTIFILVVGVYSFLALQTIASNMPYNPLRSGKFNASIVTIFPEAWAFFTRSPREEQIYLYRLENDRLVEESYQNTNADCLFGLSKNQRAKGIEIGHLFETAVSKKNDWATCEDDLNNCKNWGSLPAVSVINPSYSKQVCGEYYLVSRKIIPWAWSASRDNIHMPSKVIKINALCLKPLVSKKELNP